MKAMTITDQTFAQEVLQSHQLTIVDFWAPWCGPCKMIAPFLEEIATRYDGTLKVVKLNVDENREKAQGYGIISIPTLLFFKDGQVVDRLVGAVPRGQLESRIQKLLQVQEQPIKR